MSNRLELKSHNKIKDVDWQAIAVILGPPIFLALLYLANQIK